jgi:FG-GAP repeat
MGRSTTIDIVELQLRLAQGDEAKFKALYVHYSSRLFQFAYAILIGQEVLEVINQAINGLPPKCKLIFRLMPREVQLLPIYSICAGDLNHDGSPDLLLGGNNAWNRIKFGRNRANHGLVLINDGKGNFSLLPQSATGLRLRGDVRSMELIHGQKGVQLVVGMNGDSVVSSSIIRSGDF